MFALVYSSVSAFSGDFDILLATCRRNNERDELTGCLLHVYDDQGGPAYFAQVLEGDQKSVEAAYSRIADDRRHRDVRVLRSGPIRDRRFTGSPMRLAELSSAQVLASAPSSVEVAVRDAEAMGSLLASYGDDVAPSGAG